MTAQPASPDNSPAEDLARPAIERQMAKLERLADIGMEIVEGLGKIVARQVEAAEPEVGFDAAAITLAYHRAARAVRMSFALQQAVIDRLADLSRTEADRPEKTEQARAAETQARQARAHAQAPAHVRKVQIGQVVTGILEDAHGDDEDGYERHVREAQERLRDHELLDDVLGRPVSEIIADICGLLGIDPNWEGLAFEAWALEERDSGKLGAPLRAPPPWMGKRPGIRGALLTPRSAEEPPPSPACESPALRTEQEDTPAPAPPPPEPEVAQAPPPYVPPPDPDILPGYPVGLPGEYPPERPKRRPYWA